MAERNLIYLIIKTAPVFVIISKMPWSLEIYIKCICIYIIPQNKMVQSQS